jgi:hypothetical protein
VNLLDVNYVGYFVNVDTTRTAIIPFFRITFVLLAMRWGISNVEDIPKTWQSCRVSPADLLRRSKEPVEDSFSTITTTTAI